MLEAGTSPALDCAIARSFTELPTVSVTRHWSQMRRMGRGDHGRAFCTDSSSCATPVLAAAANSWP